MIFPCLFTNRGHSNLYMSVIVVVTELGTYILLWLEHLTLVDTTALLFTTFHAACRYFTPGHKLLPYNVTAISIPILYPCMYESLYHHKTRFNWNPSLFFLLPVKRKNKESAININPSFFVSLPRCRSYVENVLYIIIDRQQINIICYVCKQ